MPFIHKFSASRSTHSMSANGSMVNYSLHISRQIDSLDLEPSKSIELF